MSPTQSAHAMAPHEVFGDFAVQYSDTDYNLSDELRPCACVLMALSDKIGLGISFTSPMAA